MAQFKLKYSLIPLASSALVAFLFCLNPAQASNSGITYQGRILKPDGSPLSGTSTQFKLQIRTPDANDCLMYEEVQMLDMHDSKGVFSLTLNDGSGSRTDSTSLTLDRIFANRGTFTFNPATCTAGGGTYAPNTSDGRNLVVLFKDETMMTWEPIPAQKMNYIPFAFEAKQVAGFAADSLLRVVNGSGDPLTGLSPLSNAQYSELLALANGTSTNYTKTGQLNGSALPAMNSGEVLGWNGTSWVSTTSTPGANSITTSMIQSGAVTTSQIASNVTINTSGTVGAAITTTRDFKIYAASPSTFYVDMQAPALTASYSLVWPLTAGTANQVLTTDGSGNLSWSSPAASGITALTGDVTANGTGSVAATVAAVGGSTAANVHAAEVLANAATSSNTASALVKRDASGNFSAGTLTSTAITTGVATATSVVLKDSGSNTVTVQAPTTVTSSYVLKLPAAVASSSGQVLSSDTSGNLSWTTLSTSPTGTAGGDLSGTYPNPSVATVGTSTAANVHAAEVLANAATAANTSSALVKRDGSGNFAANVATLNAVALNNSGSIVNLVNPAGAAYTLTLPATAGSNGYALTTNGSGTTSWSPLLTSSTAYVNGGNTFGAASSLGNNDNFDLAIKTNNVARVTVTAAGGVGIGTTSPSARLTLAAGTATAGTAPLKFTSGTLLTTAEDGAMEYNSGSGLYFTIGSTRYVIPTNTAAGNYSNVSTISNSGGSITMTPGAGNSVIVNQSTTSTSSSTGALVVSGGVGVAGAINSGGNITAGGSITATTNGVIPQLYGSTAASGNIKIDGTSNATAGNVLLATAGGSVGIGTTSPVSLLDIGSAANTGTLRQAITIQDAGYSNPTADGTLAAGDKFVMWNGAAGAAPPIKNAIGADVFGMTLQASGNLASHIGFWTGPTSGAAPSERVRIDSAGNVGIGTTSPSAKLQVAGAIAGAAFTVANASPLAVDFSNGNVGIAAAASGTGVAVSNMAIGGAYTLIIQDSTSRTYDFTNGGSGSQCATATTRYAPANAATSASSHSVYSILYAGTGTCYITWITGF